MGKTTLDILVKGRYGLEIVIDKLRAFECSSRRKNGIHQDAPLFSEKKKNRGGKNTRGGQHRREDHQVSEDYVL